jgi:hypothetical protein
MGCPGPLVGSCAVVLLHFSSPRNVFRAVCCFQISSLDTLLDLERCLRAWKEKQKGVGANVRTRRTSKNALEEARKSEVASFLIHHLIYVLLRKPGKLRWQESSFHLSV